ncbi:MAG: DUF1549 domain-containing protein, partial [Pirellulaceae bacterium]|nr:DUF1549 domain-containing protein [Pirellulaceae bacterium]
MSRPTILSRIINPALLLAALGLTVGPATVSAADITYESDVRPIFKAHCFQCHGEGGVVEGKLDLRLRRYIVKGGETGPAIAPGKPADSLLVRRVANGEMPPSEDVRLSAQDVEILTRWVAADAPTARDEPEAIDGSYFTAEERNWWSLRPVKRPPPPATAASDSAIDSFLLAKLTAFGQQQSSPAEFGFAAVADGDTLIRRIYLDMLGVAPRADQVEAFRADQHPAAWARLVDQVLASPQYGERWGRHWLDGAGYADSEGYTDEDRVRENAYRYRDYVIRALNADRSYADFVAEQLAGDELVGWPRTELRPEIVDTLAATGFLRMAPDGTASGGIDQDVARNQVVADTLQIVATSLLGISIHCAQCHDHRYDPISQRDYYQLRAVFEPALDWKHWRAPPNRQVSLYTAEQKLQREEIEKRAKAADAKRQERVDFYIDRTLEHELLMVADGLRGPLREAFRCKPAERSAEQKKLLDDHTNVAKITAGSLYLYDRRREARAKDLDASREEKLAQALGKVKSAALEALDEPLRGKVTAAFAAAPGQRTEEQRQLMKTHPAVGATSETLAQFDPAA